MKLNNTASNSNHQNQLSLKPVLRVASKVCRSEVIYEIISCSCVSTSGFLIWWIYHCTHATKDSTTWLWSEWSDQSSNFNL